MAKPRLLFSIVLAIAASTAVAGKRVPLPDIDNALADCLSIEPKRMRLERGHAVLDADVALARPIGECGCTSAMAAYHAIATQGERKQRLPRGEVALKTGGLKSLVLGDGRNVINATEVVVALSCSGA